MVDLCQEGRSLRSAPQRRHMAHLRWCPLRHPGNPAAGPGRWLKCTVRLGQGTHQALGRLSCSDLGRARNARPTKSVPLWCTPEPEPEQLRSGKCRKPRACFGQFLFRATWSLSSVDPESKSACEWGQTQCGPDTASTPHTCQCYLFAVLLPPHSTTEQVSLNKWPPSTTCVSVEIGHWRDLKTEEAKIKKE